jgi:hypothetical protein
MLRWVVLSEVSRFCSIEAETTARGQELQAGWVWPARGAERLLSRRPARAILHGAARDTSLSGRARPGTRSGSVNASQSTSLTLLQRLRAREQDAWKQLLHLYTPLVRAWCQHQGVLGPDADDVVQAPPTWCSRPAGGRRIAQSFFVNLVTLLHLAH